MRRLVIPLVLAVAVACAAGVLLLRGSSPSSSPPEEWVERTYNCGVGAEGSNDDSMVIENLEVWFPFWQRFENLKLEPWSYGGDWTIENTPLGVRCVLRARRADFSGRAGLGCGWRVVVPKHERPFPTYENKVKIYVSYVSPKPITLLCTLTYQEEGFEPIVIQWGEWKKVFDQPDFYWDVHGTGFFEVQAIGQWVYASEWLENLKRQVLENRLP
jgi:hypothetical protein